MRTLAGSKVDSNTDAGDNHSDTDNDKWLSRRLLVRKELKG
jgi:hypothetical protein